MKKMLQLNFVPVSVDLALLLLRVWYGAAMIYIHGWDKLMTFSSMASAFPDPLGVGARNSLILAVTGELVCSVFLILGLFTRLAALGAAVTMGVAFWGVHNLTLKGEHSGELAFVYMGVFLALLFAGAGRFSLDARGGAKG